MNTGKRHLRCDSDRCDIRPQKLKHVPGKMIHPGTIDQDFTYNLNSYIYETEFGMLFTC
jgi:hypothetical protein